MNSLEEIRTFRDDLLENKESFLLVSGNVGCGKTFAVKNIYEFIKEKNSLENENCLFITQMELKYLLEKIQKETGQLFNLMVEIREISLLVFDDLGTRNPSDELLDFLYCVLKYRNLYRIRTIFTTNLTLKELRNKFGNHIFNLLTSGNHLHLEGEDRRLKDCKVIEKEKNI